METKPIFDLFRGAECIPKCLYFHVSESSAILSISCHKQDLDHHSDCSTRSKMLRPSAPTQTRWLMNFAPRHAPGIVKVLNPADRTKNLASPALPSSEPLPRRRIGGRDEGFQRVSARRAGSRRGRNPPSLCRVAAGGTRQGLLLDAFESQSAIAADCSLPQHEQVGGTVPKGDRYGIEMIPFPGRDEVSQRISTWREGPNRGRDTPRL